MSSHKNDIFTKGRHFIFDKVYSSSEKSKLVITLSDLSKFKLNEDINVVKGKIILKE